MISARSLDAAGERLPEALQPLLKVRGLTRLYGVQKGCQHVSFDLYPGEVLGIVGESGSGKSTLLSLLSGRCPPDRGSIDYRSKEGDWFDLYSASEAQRRTLLRTEWGFVEQNPRDGLRMGVSAGANIGERLMAQGVRNYQQLRGAALDWLTQVEIDPQRIDDLPRTFSGGMQQRLAIAQARPAAGRADSRDRCRGQVRDLRDHSQPGRGRYCGDCGLQRSDGSDGYFRPHSGDERRRNHR